MAESCTHSKNKIKLDKYYLKFIKFDKYQKSQIHFTTISTQAVEIEILKPNLCCHNFFTVRKLFPGNAFKIHTLFLHISKSKSQIQIQKFVDKQSFKLKQMCMFLIFDNSTDD